MKLRFMKEESGMAMALAVIMIALLGVMGAGLLVFATTDLGIVVESNRGQRAFEMADAGVQAAERQLATDSGADPALYDGTGSDEVQWSYNESNMSCTTPSGATVGNKGMCLKDLDGNSDPDDLVNITIQSIGTTSFKVVSTGVYGDAKRKIEAILQLEPAVSIPRVYFTRGGLILTGSGGPTDISLFALGNIQRSGAASISGNDEYFGRWAATSGLGPYPNSVGSYPNDFNQTARSGTEGVKAGAAALGTVSGFPTSELGKRYFGSNTYPSTVQNYGSTYDSSKISFPFEIPSPARDQQSIDRLRERALALEQLAIQQGNLPGSAATQYYIDSIPGNGLNDAGMPNRASATSPLIIDSWYPTSNYETVRFYEFQSYNSNNVVNYGGGSLPSSCPTDDEPPTSYPTGVIVVQNGDMLVNSNRAFYGGMVVRAYDSSGNLLPPPTIVSPPDSESNYRNGSFRGEGTTCIKGYANASGNTKISGNIEPGSAPELGGLSSFSTRIQTSSWRELYN